MALNQSVDCVIGWAVRDCTGFMAGCIRELDDPADILTFSNPRRRLMHIG